MVLGSGASLVPRARTHTFALCPASSREIPVGVLRPTSASTVMLRNSALRLALMALEEPTVKESPSTNSPSS
ncbi:MAG: hypothetical protein V9E82_10030 [Candidatus Nanopelagicales bacterium]